LSGLAERHGEDAGQQQHVEDVVAVVEDNDLRDIVLAGHSYSGIPVGQAAGRIGDRLRRVVYVDSNIPADGQSFVDGWSAEAQNVGLQRGDWVSVTPDDYGNPVTGRLLAWSAEEVVLRHEDPSVGAVNLHFPRVGFDVAAEQRRAA